MKCSLKNFFVFMCIILMFIAANVTARGARGGGRGSSSRGSRGSSSRGSSRSSSRSVSQYGSSWWVAGAAAGGYVAARTRVYGLSYYQQRRSYRSDSEPTVCHNPRAGCLRENLTDITNITILQQTVYNASWCMYDFICPTINDGDGDTYCCGDENGEGQYCCGFWDSPGRAAGASIGILIAVVAVVVGGVFLYKCLRSRSQRQKRSSYYSGGASHPPPPAPSAFSSTNNLEMNKQSYSAPYAPPPYGSEQNEYAPAPESEVAGYPGPPNTEYPASAPYPPRNTEYPASAPYPPSNPAPYPVTNSFPQPERY